MKAEKTISTHVSGDARARRHNKRDREVTDNEPHIDPNGYHETLVDESTVHAYHRLFDPAVEEYNARQTRADRKIKNYHAKVEADPRKHTCYEMTVCVGSKDNPVDRNLGYAIMREYVDGWKDRNPNLELIGAYYHADEEGVPGWHLDFIPVGHGFKNGPFVQTALSRALVEQGFGYVKGRNEDGLRQTPQIQWERSENDTLEAICNKYGVKVEHPERGKDVKHLTTSDYKELQDEVHELKSQVEQLSGELENAKSENKDLKDKNANLEKVVIPQNQKKADKIISDANTEAQKIKSNADEQAENIVSDANDQARTIRSSAWDQAKNLVSEAKKEIEQSNEELSGLRAEKKQLDEDLPGLRAEKKQLDEELPGLRTEEKMLEDDKKTLEGDIKDLDQRKESKQVELSEIESGASERLEKANKQKEQADNIVSQIPKGLDEISAAVEGLSETVMDASGSLKKEKRRSDNIEILATFDEKWGRKGIKQYSSVVIKDEDYMYLTTMAGKAESLKDVPDSMKEISDKQNQLEASVTRYLTPIDDLVEEEAEKKEKQLKEELQTTQNNLNLSEYHNGELSMHNQQLEEENGTLNTELSSYKAIKQAFPDKVKALEDAVSRSWIYDEPTSHGAR